MAFPTAVNNQITDATAQADVLVLGSAPVTAMGNIYQAAAQALALTMQNAVSQQQAMNNLAMAILTRSLRQLEGPIAADIAAS